MNTEELKQAVVSIICKKLPLPHYKIFCFGSQANGTAGDRSDIDIGIEAPAPLPASVLLDLQEAVDELLDLRKIDIVDFHNVTSDFRRVALERVEVLYEQ